MIIIVEKGEEQLINWDTEEKDKQKEVEEIMKKVNEEEKIQSVTLEFIEDTPISYANSLFSGQVQGERVSKQTIILST